MKPTVAHLLPNYNPFPPVFPAGTELRVEQVSLRQRRYRPVVICGHFPGQRESEAIGTLGQSRPSVKTMFEEVYATEDWRLVEQRREVGV